MEGERSTKLSRRKAVKKMGYGVFTASTMMTILNANAQNWGNWDDVNQQNSAGSFTPRLKNAQGPGSSIEIPSVTFSISGNFMNIKIWNFVFAWVNYSVDRDIIEGSNFIIELYVNGTLVQSNSFASNQYTYNGSYTSRSEISSATVKVKFKTVVVAEADL